MPARVHRESMPCITLPLPCPYLRASSACARLPCFLSLHDLSPRLLAYGVLDGCAQAPLNMWVHAYHCCAIYSKRWALISFSDICVLVEIVGGHALAIPPLPILSPPTPGPNIPRVLFHRPRPLGEDFPPQPWSRGGDTYDRRAAAPTLFDFVQTITSSMHSRYLTPILPPTQRPCM